MDHCGAVKLGIDFQMRRGRGNDQARKIWNAIDVLEVIRQLEVANRNMVTPCDRRQCFTWLKYMLLGLRRLRGRAGKKRCGRCCQADRRPAINRVRQ
jgi:hypothetical protein